MGLFDVLLVDHGVLHGGVDFCMSQEALHLFNGHSFVDGPGSKCSAEFVGMHSGDIQSSAELPKTNLHAAYLKSFEGVEQRNK